MIACHLLLTSRAGLSYSCSQYLCKEDGSASHTFSDQRLFQCRTYQILTSDINRLETKRNPINPNQRQTSLLLTAINNMAHFSQNSHIFHWFWALFGIFGIVLASNAQIPPLLHHFHHKLCLKNAEIFAEPILTNDYY